MNDQTYSWTSTAVLVLVGLSIALTGSAAAQSADMVVATDGSGDYASIQNAVDNADDIDKIEIKSGTYKESVTIDKNVTIVAPERATLAPSPSGAASSGITITKHAAPQISGFDIQNFDNGINAGIIGSKEPTNRDWTVTNISINGNNEGFSSGIQADRSSGEFLVRNVDINNTHFGIRVARSTGAWQGQNITINNPQRDGISAYQSTGEWAIEDITVNNAGGDGVFAHDSRGDWTVESTTIINASDDGISAENTSGQWTLKHVMVNNAGGRGVKFDDSSGNSIIQDIKITSVESGIEAFTTTGDWLIENATVEDATDKGISVDQSNGSWTIESSTVQNISGDGIDAFQADDGLISNVVVKNITDENGINLGETSGDWVIEDSTIRSVNGPGEAKHGIVTNAAAGDWTIQNTSIKNISGAGIDAYNQSKSSHATVENLTVTDTKNHGITFYDSNGDWEVIDSYISDSENKGIEAGETTGNWSIVSTTVETTSGVLIDASGTTGNWEIHESKLSTEGEALNGTGAVEGNASYNYWGAADGPSGEFCGSGGEVKGNVTMYPYYTDSSLTTLSSATTSGTVQISRSCLIPENINASDEHELVLTLSQISADGQSDNIMITMPERVSVDSVGNPRALGTPYEVNVTNGGDPIKMEVNPDAPAETVDFVLRVPIELSSNEG